METLSHRVSRLYVTGFPTARQFIASYPTELREFVRAGIKESRKANPDLGACDSLDGEQFNAWQDGYLFIACY